MRYLLMTLALAGCIVSVLALRVHYSSSDEALMCDINDHWDCGAVNHSPFANTGFLLAYMLDSHSSDAASHSPFVELDHIPVAADGIAGYLLLIPLCFWRVRKYLLLCCLGGLSFALYLTYIEEYVLHKWCIYCVISLGIISLMTILSLVWAISSRKKTA